MTGSYRTYYVNQKTGRDSNDGLTMDSPFASLFQVNRLKLYPGDKVLLARDSIFTDYGQRDEGFTDCDRCI